MHRTSYGPHTNANEETSYGACGQVFPPPVKTGDLETQRSFIQRGAAQLSRFSNSVRGSSQLDNSGGTSTNSRSPVHYNARYNNSSDESAHHLLVRPKFTHKEEQITIVESMVCSPDICATITIANHFKLFRNSQFVTVIHLNAFELLTESVALACELRGALQRKAVSTTLDH